MQDGGAPQNYGKTRKGGALEAEEARENSQDEEKSATVKRSRRDNCS